MNPPQQQQLSQRTKTPARTADPNTTAFFGWCFPRTQKPFQERLPEHHVCPGRVFLRKQKPLLGTHSRTPRLLSGGVLSQKQTAPAGNTDPNNTAFFSHVFPKKTRALARNADLEHHGFLRSCFFQEKKAPARNADPNTTAFIGHVYPRKQKPLLGTPVRDG